MSRLALFHNIGRAGNHQCDRAEANKHVCARWLAGFETASCRASVLKRLHSYGRLQTGCISLRTRKRELLVKIEAYEEEALANKHNTSPVGKLAGGGGGGGNGDGGGCTDANEAKAAAAAATADAIPSSVSGGGDDEDEALPPPPLVLELQSENVESALDAHIAPEITV